MLKQRPSSLLGLEADSYEAYCLDEAIVYFGTTVEGQLEKVGQKPSKGERKAQAARERLLSQILGSGEKKSNAGFADPAAMFK